MSTLNRKPRIALMGEFSAGKSTLSNLLLGARPLPEKVTATRLSPVWMSKGSDAPYRVDVDGTEEPVSLEQLETIPVEETRVIRLFFEADILDLCDLIDFPGISDPNMSAEVWQRMVPEVDAVLWCTHATQAWRQSEAAAWETIPDDVRARSALLITRFDKLTTDRDKYRVLTRVKKETTGLFSGTFPISLTEALAAGEDSEAFEASGGGALLEYLLPMIEDLTGTLDDAPVWQPAPVTAEEVATPVEDTLPEPVAEADLAEASLETAHEPEFSPEFSAPEMPVDDSPEPEELVAEAPSAPAVIPRRVRPVGGPRVSRPARPTPTGLVMDNAADVTRPAANLSGASKLRSIFQGGDGNEVA